MAHSNTNVEQLGEAYKNCASTAASMGYSLEEVTAVLMTMANTGVKGGEAGTTLNAIMTRLATDTKGCATELHNKGLSENAEASGQSFMDYAEALNNADEASKGMAKTMSDNLSSDLKTMQSAFEEYEPKKTTGSCFLGGFPLFTKKLWISVDYNSLSSHLLVSFLYGFFTVCHIFSSHRVIEDVVIFIITDKNKAMFRCFPCDKLSIVYPYRIYTHFCHINACPYYDRYVVVNICFAKFFE